MRIYLIRHAEPDYPNHTITARGHEEAKALAAYLKTIGLDRIYSSPVNRAMHTMKYTAELMGMEPTIEPWTQELSGWGKVEFAGENIVVWNNPGERVRSIVPPIDRESWKQAEPYRALTEKFAEIQANSDEFLSRLGYVREGGKYRIVRRNREKIALFCHLGFGLVWLAHLLELPFPLMWSGFWLPPSSITTILMEERSAEWAVPRVLGMGAVTHLHAAGQKVSSAGLLAEGYTESLE
jgi:probable phosphoglycerate mutase